MGFRHAVSKLLRRLTGSFDDPSIVQRLDRLQSQLERLEQGFSANSSVTQHLDRIQLQLSRLERMSHGGRATYIGNNRILTKCVIADAVIGFLVDADDILLSPWLILSGMYELDITNFFLSNLKPNSRCLDVGANFGFFTCLMARFCHQGKVVGVEPNHHVYELMRDNIYINGLQEWASPKHAAISDLVGTLKLYRRIKRSGNTSIFDVPEALLEALGEPRSEPFQVACLRIDDLLLEFDNRIDFIKIDVEGAEPLAMRGAQQTISANPHLNIIMEWSPAQIQAAGFNIAEFVDDLAAMGLRSSEIKPDRVEEISLEGLKSLGYRAGILLTPSK
ncbi:MAG: FkbM family methyltransferase [Stellaceae bacterium]